MADSPQKPARKRTARKRKPTQKPGVTRATRGQPPIIEKGWNHLDRTWTNDSPCGRFLAAMRIGNYIHVACAFAGISTTTWKNWNARAREHHVNEFEEPDWDAIPESEVPYVAFITAVTRAEAESEVELVGLVRKVGKGNDKLPPDWRAAMALLSRRHAGRWRERTGVDVQPTAGSDLSKDDIGRLLKDDKVLEGAQAIEEALATAEAEAAEKARAESG